MKRGLEQGDEEMEGDVGKGISRCVWTEQEDEALCEMAEKYKGEYWNLVAEHVQKVTSSNTRPKTAKQCRERWHNQLKPDVQLGPLSEMEEQKVFALHEKFGNRWSKIAKKLSGRTDNIIKNYFLCRLRRVVRWIKKATVKQLQLENETELSQTLYLVDYLYTYYISPDRQVNILKSLNSQIKKRRNHGDKYINKMVVSEGITANKLSSFSKSLMAAANSCIEKAESKFQKYKYLLNLSSSSAGYSPRSCNLSSPSSHQDEAKNRTFSLASCMKYS